MRIFGNLMNRVAEHTAGKPEVGMGATICWYTDRQAATVITIINENRIVVQRDKAIRIDTLGRSDCGQQYKYEPDPQGQRTIFSKRKNGTWKEYRAHRGGLGLRLGERDEHYDFSF